MSESHDIEQIARDWARIAGPWCEYEGDFAADLATDIRALIASAREEGAKSMQERAAVIAEAWRKPENIKLVERYGGMTHEEISTAQSVAGGICAGIRALPLNPASTTEKRI